MPRDGNNVYFPDWTPGVPNATIASANANAMVADIAQDLNTARPVSMGGTGATNGVGASDNLAAGSATVSSASTANIAGASSVNVTISGTTTITAFGTAAAGVKRFLTFSGILTLTYHATSMILPGLANITTAAGDSCVAVSLGSGNWKVTIYTRAASTPGTVPASETVAGIVEKATPAEVYSATADKYLAADHLETASESVALTDATTVAVDWETFVNGTVELSADRALGNPTNGIPGTWRTVLVSAATSTERTLTPGNQYGGEVPTMDDITDTKWYLLTLYCVTATHFLLSAQDASPP